ncbi:MAG: helix-turn-helix transcriptional regulator [Chloroflexi bacterium]|nr:helix-turn-helix transcriptional regulator [Chloroflexota bacterium]
MESKSSLGQYVRSLRRQKRWSLQVLAESVGLSASRISRIETDSAIPTADTVVKLANALGGDIPNEILERLLRRVGGGTAPHRRLAGKERDDPTFAADLIEDIDPDLRSALTAAYQLSDEDVDGIFSVLQRLASMDQVDRNAIIGFLTAKTGDGG